MATSLLALDFVANLIAAAIYGSVARLLAARPVEAQAVQARRAFAAWWGLLAVLALFGAAFDVISMLGGWSLPLLLALTHVLLLAILAAFGALLYYLVYLYTGWEQAWRWIGAGYVALWGVLVFLVAYSQPDGLQKGPIHPRLHYVNDLEGSLVGPVLAFVFLLPVLAGAVGYFTLFFKAREPTQRYRIAVVSLSLVLWFTFSLVGSVAGLNHGLGWIVLSRVVSLGAAACVYAAYRPPRWVRRRWGVGGLPAADFRRSRRTPR